MATRVLKSAATVTPDPTVKSRTFVAPQKGGYQSAQLRASDIQRGRPGSLLGTPTWKGYFVPKTRFLTGPSPAVVYPTSARFLGYQPALPDGLDPGLGRSYAGGTILLISTTDLYSASALPFLTGLERSTTITYTDLALVITNTFTRTGAPTKFATYWSIPVSLASFGGYPGDENPVQISYS